MVKTGTERTTTIKLDSEWLKRLDKLAERADLSRRQLMKNMLNAGIEEIDVLKKLGFFKLGLLARQLDEKRGKAEGWKETGEAKPSPVTLDDSTWQTLDELAEIGDMSRHQLVRNILYVGIEELEIFKKVGFFQINDARKFLGKAYRVIVEDGQRALKAIQGKDQ